MLESSPTALGIMNIAAEGLSLEMRVVTLADAQEGWARVQVQLAVPGFTGDFVAWLQVADVERFAARRNVQACGGCARGDAMLGRAGYPHTSP